MLVRAFGASGATHKWNSGSFLAEHAAAQQLQARTPASPRPDLVCSDLISSDIAPGRLPAARLICPPVFPCPADSPQIFHLLGGGTNTALINSVAVGVTKAIGVIIGECIPLTPTTPPPPSPSPAPGCCPLHAGALPGACKPLCSPVRSERTSRGLHQLAGLAGQAQRALLANHGSWYSSCSEAFSRKAAQSINSFAVSLTST